MAPLRAAQAFAAACCCLPCRAADVCDGLQGRYDVGVAGARADIEVSAQTRILEGIYTDPAGTEIPFSGRLIGDCFGDVLWEGEERAFSQQNHTLSWSTGQHWTRHGFEANAANHQQVVLASSQHKVATTVATMLLGGFSANVGALYLLNWPDPDIRLYTYAMLSTAMAVFCAIMLNEAMVTFLFDQVIACAGPSLGLEPTWMVKTMTALIYMVAAWCLLTVICWQNPRDARFRMGTCGLGAHLVGFAAQTTADNLMRLQNEEDVEEGGTVLMSSLTFGMAFGCLVVLKQLTRFIRERVLAAKEGAGRGKEALDDAENEAIAQVMSYLVATFFCQAILGHLPGLELSEKTARGKQVCCLAIGGLGFAVSSWVARVLTKRMRSGEQRTVKFICTTLVDTLAMCTSWCFYLASLWGMGLVFERVTFLDSKLVRVVNAFAVTCVGVLLMLAVDKLADRSEEAAASPPRSPAAAASVRTLIDAEEEMLPRRSSTILDGLAEGLHTVDHADISEGLRIFLRSLGFWIALSWDKAFECAEQQALHFFVHTMHVHHETVAKAVFAFLLVSFTLPAWWCYIVPASLKDKKAHAEDIAKARERAERFSRGRELRSGERGDPEGGDSPETSENPEGGASSEEEEGL